MSSTDHPATCRCHACACCQEENDHYGCAECRATKGCPEDCECPLCSLCFPEDEDFDEMCDKVDELRAIIAALTKEKDAAWAAYRRVKGREAGGAKAAPAPAPKKAAAGGGGRPAIPPAVLPKPASQPRAEDFPVEIDPHRCQCRIGASKIEGFTPAVYAPGQCRNKPAAGSDICERHQRIQEGMADGNMKKAIHWFNRLSEPVPEWSHMIGTTWFNHKAKWSE